MLDAYVEPVNLDRAMAGARLGLTDALDGDSAYLDARGVEAPASSRRKEATPTSVSCSPAVSPS